MWTTSNTKQQRFRPPAPLGIVMHRQPRTITLTNDFANPCWGTKLKPTLTQSAEYRQQLSNLTNLRPLLIICNKAALKQSVINEEFLVIVCL